VDLAHLVEAPGVEEDPLGGRRLTRIDVRDDPDVAEPLEAPGSLLDSLYGDFFVSSTVFLLVRTSISTGSG
jgi:hypothetical protein